MANITVTSSTNSVRVDFGIYSASIERSKGVWRKNSISFNLATNFVEVNITNEKSWHVSNDGNSVDGPTFQVDLVDSAPPASLADLYDKLQTLLD